MFTLNHFIWLLLCFIFICLGLIFAYKKRLSLDSAYKITLGISLVSEVSKMTSNIIESTNGGYILDPKDLPFHLCSLLIFILIYITFTDNDKFKNFALSFYAPTSIVGGIMALLIPTNGVDFFTIKAYQCFVYHAGIIWLGMYLLISKQVDLGLRSYFRNLIFLICLALASLYVNSILSIYETNFMFTSKPPLDNLPILNLDDGWFSYVGRMGIIGISLLSLFHLPFIICEKKCEE